MLCMGLSSMGEDESEGANIELLVLDGRGGKGLQGDVEERQGGGLAGKLGGPHPLLPLGLICREPLAGEEDMGENDNELWDVSPPPAGESWGRG